MSSEWAARREAILDVFGLAGTERDQVRPVVEMLITVVCRVVVAIRAKS